MGKQKITITLDANLVDDIKIQAIKEHRSASDIINELVKEYLENVRKNPAD